jgi:hypothetical protein
MGNHWTGKGAQPPRRTYAVRCARVRAAGARRALSRSSLPRKTLVRGRRGGLRRAVDKAAGVPGAATATNIRINWKWQRSSRRPGRDSDRPRRLHPIGRNCHRARSIISVSSAAQSRSYPATSSGLLTAWTLSPFIPACRVCPARRQREVGVAAAAAPALRLVAQDANISGREAAGFLGPMNTPISSRSSCLGWPVACAVSPRHPAGSPRA